MTRLTWIYSIYALPRGVTVAQVILDHFVMVRIHARQPKTLFLANEQFVNQGPLNTESWEAIHARQPGTILCLALPNLMKD